LKRSKGYRSKSRGILRRPPRQRGQRSLGYILREYEVGEKVGLYVDPSTHAGEPHRRYHGKTGKIMGKRGSSYLVQVRDGRSLKTVIVRPEHIRSHKTSN